MSSVTPIQAYCIICYEAIRKLSVYYVHCLWDDNGYSGRPICDSCYFILNDIIPEKIDVPLKKEITIKISTGQLAIDKFL